MSLKYHAAQDGPNRYRLGKTGDMQCDVLAFLSPDLYEATDEGLWTVSIEVESSPDGQEAPVSVTAAEVVYVAIKRWPDGYLSKMPLQEE